MRRPLPARISCGLVLLALVAMAARPVPAVAPRLYSVTDLGSLRAANDGTSSALALNDEGSVVGVADTDQGTRRAFRWDPGVGIQDLKDSGINFGGSGSLAAGINNLGEIVGEANTPGNPFEFSHAFFRGPGLVDLNGLAAFTGGQNSRATAVNDGGVVAGWAQVDGGAIFPFRWSAGDGIQQLFTPQAVGGKAFAINSSGALAGSMDLPALTVATVWLPGNTVVLIKFDRTTAQESYGLSDTNLVVGARRDLKGKWRAWLGNLTTQTVALLKKPSGVQQTWAYDVNNSGQIVGAGGKTTPSTLKALIWEGNKVFDLNRSIPRNSGWQLHKALAINEAGQICGEGTFQGNTRAFLLTPQQ